MNYVTRRRHDLVLQFVALIGIVVTPFYQDQRSQKVPSLNPLTATMYRDVWCFALCNKNCIYRKLA
jgi:hypothetical protein